MQERASHRETKSKDAKVQKEQKNLQVKEHLCSNP